MVATRWLHTSQGIHTNAKLRSWNRDGWQFSINDTELLTIDYSNIVRFGRWEPPKKNQALWLSDGSWLSGDLEIKPSSIRVASDWFQPVEVPVEQIRGILNNPPASVNNWVRTKAWFEGKAGENDYLRLVDGRQVEGLLSLEPGGKQLSIRVGNRKLFFGLEEVDAVAFSPTLFSGKLNAAQRLLGLEDGSLLRVQQELLSSRKSELLLTTVGGLALTPFDAPEDFASEAVRYIVGQPTSTTRLDEVEAASYRHQPASRLTWSLGVKKDVVGRPLIKEAGIVHHGLAMHSESLATYRWNGEPGTFRVELRFAPVENGGSKTLGHVNLQVLMVKNGKLTTGFQQELSRADELGVVAHVDVTGAQLIVLTTRQGEDEQFGDHILWLDPRIDTAKPAS